MSDDNKINRRLDELEKEDQVEDIVITVLTEQHERRGDELVAVHREPVGYTEVEWSGPDKRGRRIGTRYARYAVDDLSADPGNWNQNVAKTPSADDKTSD